MSDSETRELTKKYADSYPDRYKGGGGGPRDPFTTFAEESGPGIRGVKLTCKQGVWATGKDDTPLNAGLRFLLVVTETTRGWLCWKGGTVVHPNVGFVRDGFRPEPRYALGDTDKELWEKNQRGEPQDPWQRDYRTLLIGMSPPHSEYTFVSSSWGAHLALQEVCGRYAEESPAPGALPVVELTTKVRPNKMLGGGNIIGPWFNIVGWATEEDVRAGRKAGVDAAKAEQPKAKPRKVAKAAKSTAAEINDAIPDWGNK
jgi:hypothetical protein